MIKKFNSYLLENKSGSFSKIEEVYDWIEDCFLEITDLEYKLDITDVSDKGNYIFMVRCEFGSSNFTVKKYIEFQTAFLASLKKISKVTTDFTINLPKTVKDGLPGLNYYLFIPFKSLPIDFPSSEPWNPRSAHIPPA